MAPNPMAIPQKSGIQDILSVIDSLEQQAAGIRVTLEFFRDALETGGSGIIERVSFMLKNKFGLSKDEAKKLFFDFRSKKPDEQETASSGKEPESTDEKILVIMDYMKVTSEKLDKIEEDIAFLKDQVGEILKRI